MEIEDLSKKTPVYRLLKNYPGSNMPEGTIIYHTPWGAPEGTYITEFGRMSTAWDKNYFEPFVGEFFERL